MGALGIAGMLLSHELLRAAGVEPIRLLAVLVELHAGVLFGFAMVNWMSRGSLIGGINNRPVAVGNAAYFSIGALSLPYRTRAATTPPMNPNACPVHEISLAGRIEFTIIVPSAPR